MHIRTVLPVVLLLASGCAQVPTASIEQTFELRSSFLPDQPASVDAAVADIAPRPLVEIAPAEPKKAVISKSTAVTPAEAPVPRLTKPDPSKTQAVEQAAAAPAVKESEPELPSKSLWPRITKGFAMVPLESDLVREWENWYASRPDYVDRMINRSGHFLFHIVEEVEKRKMPMEVALLPMIESAYNPVAYSRSHASGIWQFIPSTGKDFGLRQNWWYDGRRDVIAATEAALDYLEKLYGMFGDWQLALAAYNWGEGAVGRAMERNRAKGLPTDYESLTVPAETRGYIPKLMAVKNIMLNPARFGLQIADIPNEPYFETVLVKRHIDVKIAAKLAEMPIDEFKFLNPGHNKPVIKAGEGELIVLPRNKVATFLANVGKHDKPFLSWQAVRLRPGEKADKVAAQHGMTLAELKQVNGLQNQKRLVTGQPLLVPLKGGSEDPQLLDLPATPVSLPKAIQAAKARAQAKKHAQATRGKAVQKVANARKPAPVLRTNNKRGKPAATAKSSASKKAPAKRVKVAER